MRQAEPTLLQVAFFLSHSLFGNSFMLVLILPFLPDFRGEESLGAMDERIEEACLCKWCSLQIPRLLYLYKWFGSVHFFFANMIWQKTTWLCLFHSMQISSIKYRELIRWFEMQRISFVCVSVCFLCRWNTKWKGQTNRTITHLHRIEEDRQRKRIMKSQIYDDRRNEMQKN